MPVAYLRAHVPEPDAVKTRTLIVLALLCGLLILGAAALQFSLATR